MKSTADTRLKLKRAFSLSELLVVMAIISILAAASASLVPSMLQSGQMNRNVTTLSGLLDLARETAFSSNTYVWVAFTANPSTASSASGVSCVIFESQDGTDILGNFTTGGSGSPLAISSANRLLVLSTVQQLAGIQLTPPGALSVASLPAVTPAPISLVGPMALTLARGGTTYTFTQVVEFTPDGQSKASSWNSWIEFGLKSSAATSSSNVAVFRLAKLTGKLTVYRP